MLSTGSSPPTTSTRNHSCGPRPPARCSPKPTPSRLPERSTSSLACRDARATEGPLALGGAPSGVEAVGRRPGRLGARRFCYAIDDGERLLLFDPLALPAELEELAGSRETAVVLTNTWHERDARDLAERLGAQVFVPPPDAPGRMEGKPYTAGDRLPVGVEARPGSEPPFDHMLWVEGHRAIVIGDSLIDNGTGLTLFDRWIPEGQTREQVLERLRPLLELPVEIVLPTHGAPTDRAALERALT